MPSRCAAASAPFFAPELILGYAKVKLDVESELVCVSDDPGEAAGNFVILELMGFPDLKVPVRQASAYASAFLTLATASGA
jgi:hypothetical protein